jgi:AefR-like transcriptional repressor, C-terminal domain
MLLDHAKRHALVHWQLYGWGYQGAVAIRRGDVATGLHLLRSCFTELGETGVTAPRFMRFAAVYMAEGLAKAGQITDALDAIDDAIGRAERTGELWQFAELLRVKGELVLLQDAPTGCRCGRLFPASVRLGGSAGRPVMGTARRGEPRSAAAQSGPFRGGTGAPSDGLRSLHRRIRDGRSESCEGPSRRPARARGRCGKSGPIRRPSLKNLKFLKRPSRRPGAAGCEEEILREMLLRLSGQLKDAFPPGIETRGEVEDVLRLIARMILGLPKSAEYLGFLRMVVADSRQFPWIAEEFAAVMEPQTERLVRYIAHLTAIGILDCRNPMLAAHQFMRMLNELSLWPWMTGRESVLVPEKGDNRRGDPDVPAALPAPAIEKVRSRQPTRRACSVARQVYGSSPA